MTILNQEVMQRPERRRREGRCSARFAFAWRSSLFCVPVLFLYLCLLWVYVFYGFYVGSAKLQCGATPPSVMVLFCKTFCARPSPGIWSAPQDALFLVPPDGSRKIGPKTVELPESRARFAKKPPDILSHPRPSNPIQHVKFL